MAYAQDKNTSARLCAKNAGGGAYSWDTMVYVCILSYYISFPLFIIGSLHVLSEEDG